MPNVKISQAADAGTLLSSDMLPLARSGNTTAYHATMAEIATFANASVSSGAYGNVGRNLLHNGLFNVQQRGQGPFTTFNTYNADRWTVGGSVSTYSLTLGTQSDAGRAQIGDEAATQFMAVQFTGTAGAGDYVMLAQRIEGVRRLGNKTVTVSFYAAATSGTPKLGVSWAQIFGTGGSPSAPVVSSAGQSVTLSTTWTRYSVTLTLPSTTGKTLGTNGDDATQLELWMTGGSNFNARSGNVGVQSGFINLWGMQLEIGGAATPLEKLDPRMDVANCMRFFQTGTIQHDSYNAAGGSWSVTLSAIELMRAPPTITFAVITNANCTVNVGQLGAQQFNMYGTVTATGQFQAQANYDAAADL
jgi:hypothetical protein